MRRRLLILILIFFPLSAKALDLTISNSAYYLNFNDPNYQFKDNFDLIKQSKNYTKGINTGLTFKPSKMILTITTNRLGNNVSKRNVIDRSNGLTFINEITTETDSLLIGYQYGRLIPSLFIANAKISKRLFNDTTLIGSDIEHAILGGVNLAYILTNKVSANLILIAPNKALHLQYGIGLGINYNYNLI